MVVLWGWAGLSLVVICHRARSDVIGRAPSETELRLAKTRPCAVFMSICCALYVRQTMRSDYVYLVLFFFFLNEV